MHTLINRYKYEVKYTRTIQFNRINCGFCVCLDHITHVIIVKSNMTLFGHFNPCNYSIALHGRYLFVCHEVKA